MDDRLYFRQLLAGRDFATQDAIAQQMANFVYLIGDRATGEAVVVDPAYAPGELVEVAGADDMRIVGAMATHYHQDHVGGEIFGHEIAGITELLEHVEVPLHVQADELEWVAKVTGLGADRMISHTDGDIVTVGDVPIELVHTPGHTPGSQCFCVDGRLVAGDTLFLQGCGRTDLPGSDAAAMEQSLRRLARMPAETVLFPGHNYSPPFGSATMGVVAESNPVLAGMG